MFWSAALHLGHRYPSSVARTAWASEAMCVAINERNARDRRRNSSRSHQTIRRPRGPTTAPQRRIVACRTASSQGIRLPCRASCRRAPPIRRAPLSWSRRRSSRPPASRRGRSVIGVVNPLSQAGSRLAVGIGVLDDPRQCREEGHDGHAARREGGRARPQPGYCDEERSEQERTTDKRRAAVREHVRPRQALWSRKFARRNSLGNLL